MEGTESQMETNAQWNARNEINVVISWIYLVSILKKIWNRKTRWTATQNVYLTNFATLPA